MNIIKNHPIKYFILPAVVLLGLAFAATVFANPLYVGTKARSATATTSPTYMTPGTATSTVVYDSYEQTGTNQTNTGNYTLPNTVVVAVQGNASSTLSIITVACEFSDDAIDWYQNEIYPATTTGSLPIATPVSFSFAYASSTVGGAALLANTTGFAKAFYCPVPMRYVRAVVSLTGLNARVWTTIIPAKQRN